MIESKRLYIRKMNHNDFKEISKMLQDVEVMYAWDHAFSNEEVIEWIDKNIKRYENDGYATEGATMCVDYAIKNLNANTLVADIRPENTTSINVAKRLGMKKISEYDKIYKGKVMKHDIYQLEVTGLTTKIVEILDYNPNWKYEFEKLKCTL
ncbi:TPA: GNAT family N-acetyltransferase [Clostridioides difficile]